MSDILFWIVAHGLCAIFHGGLVAASFYSFASCAMHSHGCGQDISGIILPWASFAVGSFATMFNAGLLKRILLLERPSSDSTSEHHRFKKRVVIVIGAVFNALFLITDIYFAATTSKSTSEEFKQLRPVCALAALSAIALFATIVMDIIKLVEIQRQKAEVDEVLDSLEP
ncbi:hypothetical protein AOQ84DRAFT_351561 [Glonium stellatum]|uniref:Uncharacterized protein n=1 Tax=Glonium stellatum TaxID=574774 RepID=A0A8E2FBX0_9PEZI|nr:hypothetical protein AOQ84DRAFT_351561 [Glonium stellatum]